jgi:hypothetical protein
MNDMSEQEVNEKDNNEIISQYRKKRVLIILKLCLFILFVVLYLKNIILNLANFGIMNIVITMVIGIAIISSFLYLIKDFICCVYVLYKDISNWLNQSKQKKKL